MFEYYISLIFVKNYSMYENHAFSSVISHEKWYYASGQ